MRNRGIQADMTGAPALIAQKTIAINPNPKRSLKMSVRPETGPVPTSNRMCWCVLLAVGLLLTVHAGQRPVSAQLNKCVNNTCVMIDTWMTCTNNGDGKGVVTRVTTINGTNDPMGGAANTTCYPCMGNLGGGITGICAGDSSDSCRPNGKCQYYSTADVSQKCVCPASISAPQTINAQYSLNNNPTLTRFATGQMGTCMPPNQ
jgi:hypothetical protein